jgi:hypothetical protein
MVDRHHTPQTVDVLFTATKARREAREDATLREDSGLAWIPLVKSSPLIESSASLAWTGYE